jgi:uncharacterized protein with HEPN domain
VKHPERAEDYLEHIVEAIDRVTEYLRDIHDFGGFQRDARTQDAVVRNLMIVGEAANQLGALSPGFVASHPELPWFEMRGMRNKIVHGYFDVDWSVVWDTANNDLPGLKRSVETLLRGLEDREGAS